MQRSNEFTMRLVASLLAERVTVSILAETQTSYRAVRMKTAIIPISRNVAE